MQVVVRLISEGRACFEGRPGRAALMPFVSWYQPFNLPNDELSYRDQDSDGASKCTCRPQIRHRFSVSGFNLFGSAIIYDEPILERYVESEEDKEQADGSGR